MVKKRISFIVFAGIAACLLAAQIFTAPAAAQSGGAVILFDPQTLEIGLDQVEKIDLILDNASDIYALDLRGSFDPRVVELVDMDLKQDGVQMVPGNFPKPDFLVRNSGDNSAGTFMYVLTQVNPTPPANGKGVVLSLYFKGKLNGQSSKLAVTFIESADRRGNKLPVKAAEISLKVVAPRPPTLVPPSMLADGESGMPGSNQNGQAAEGDAGANGLGGSNGGLEGAADGQSAATDGAGNGTGDPAGAGLSPTGDIQSGAAGQTDDSRPGSSDRQATQSAGPLSFFIPGFTDPAQSSQLLEYIALGGFGGAILLLFTSGLIVLRRQRTTAKTNKKPETPHE